jgi:hypothetical protein
MAKDGARTGGTKHESSRGRTWHDTVGGQHGTRRGSSLLLTTDDNDIVYQCRSKRPAPSSSSPRLSRRAARYAPSGLFSLEHLIVFDSHYQLCQGIFSERRGWGRETATLPPPSLVGRRALNAIRTPGAAASALSHRCGTSGMPASLPRRAHHARNESALALRSRRDGAARTAGAGRTKREMRQTHKRVP